jgi:hypothetical protein
MVQTAIDTSQVLRCPGEDCMAEFNEQSPYFSRLGVTEQKRLSKIRQNREVLSNPEIKLCRKEDC